MYGKNEFKVHYKANKRLRDKDTRRDVILGNLSTLGI
jgi:hypothetical protein